MPNITCSHKIAVLNNSSKETKLKKSFYFWILRCTSFLMIPLIILHDEYIDRPKLCEQKKPAEYLVPPPQGGGGGGRNDQMVFH